MKKTPTLTLNRLREVISYDGATGVFVWVVSRGRASVGKPAGKLRDTGRIIGIDGESYPAARLAWFWVHGEWPSRIVRFKDGNRDNVAIDNLVFGKTDFTTKEGKNSYARDWRKANPRSQRHLVLKRGYGLSIEQYQQMLLDQKGVCACCSKPETTIQGGQLMPLAVDHCHLTHQIRGLLCAKCNRGIGNFNDNPDVLRSAAAYLDAHAPKPKTNVIPLAGRRIANQRGN